MSNRPQIALEMLMICNIESDQRRVCQKVQLGYFVAKNVGPTVAMDQLLQFIQGLENNDYIFVVNLLVWCKASCIDALVEISLQPSTNFINSLP